ncbi:hypothetical protein Q1695_014648 [Nippostrongylus brasiliensis]|nr:hypothetical protein Q1695_014648 [Nippostrongylus brasiliensis]
MGGMNRVKGPQLHTAQGIPRMRGSRRALLSILYILSFSPLVWSIPAIGLVVRLAMLGARGGGFGRGGFGGNGWQ